VKSPVNVGIVFITFTSIIVKAVLNRFGNAPFVVTTRVSRSIYSRIAGVSEPFGNPDTFDRKQQRLSANDSSLISKFRREFRVHSDKQLRAGIFQKFVSTIPSLLL
jgi:hypothetical protein